MDSATVDVVNVENCHENDPKKDGNVTDDQKKNGHRQPTIFDAIKSGMLVPVQSFVETQGVELLKARDEKGHTPAHWACLGGHSAILRFILDNKGPVDEASDNDLAQHPIHWACVNGHIGIIDILLQVGVDIDATDRKGCTPLIVACQYGQTMLSGYMIGKGARVQAVDKDGDTALHWAAFKGHSELMRLLIYSGFNAHQKDNFGQGPLHLACIAGSLTAVKELVEQDDVDYTQGDKNGKTPLMLAAGRKHHNIVQFLKKRSQSRGLHIPKMDFWAIVFGPPGNTKGPLLFFVVNMLLWAYPMYIFKCLPMTWYDMEVLHIVFMCVNVIMWIALYHASTTDPGFLPRNIPEYDRAIKEAAHCDEWKMGRNPLSRLCHTCRTVKPVRTKHCKICNRCVVTFDHHCPYIYNCVGYKNRVWFYTFTVCISFCAVITDFLALYILRTEGWDWLVLIGGLEAMIFSVIAILVFIFSIYHMVLNLTTNERINHKRYKYLQDGKGRYYNPYDRGWKINLMEFFYLRRPLTEDEVEFLNITIV